MAHLDALCNEFTNKKKRWKSDCAVLDEIEHEFIVSEKTVRTAAAKWLMKQLESKDTNILARKKLVRFLYTHRHELPKKVHTRLRKYLHSLKKKKRTKLLYEQ